MPEQKSFKVKSPNSVKNVEINQNNQRNAFQIDLLASNDFNMTPHEMLKQPSAHDNPTIGID